jgi:hypothetical protein
MKNRPTVLVLFVSVCGLWGCAKSNDRVAASALPAVNQSDEPLSALNLPIEERKPGQALPELQIWQATPAPGSVTAEKSKPTEPAVPSSIPAKDQTAQGKPAEMKVVNAFDRDQYLSSRVKTLLPPRSTLSDTATGFKNEKHFIAAMHLSQNLNIPFDQIKTRMTGEHHISLHDALRDLRPEMTKGEIKAEVNTAEKQAKEDESYAKEEAKKAAGREKLASNQK